MVSGHGDLRRAEHGNHTRLSFTKLERPRVWAATVMTPSHRAFVWPVLQLLWIPKPIEWEGLPPLETITTNKQSPKTSSHRTNVQTTANGDSLLGFWFNTKRLFTKHFWASSFHPLQPRSGAEPSILKINKNRWIKTGITCFFKPHRDQNTGPSWEL